MNHKVGIWIDHKKAVIVSAAPDLLTALMLESEAQTGRDEKEYEHRHDRHLDRYYDDVIGHLGQPDALLIFGPGEAKLELNERLSRSKALSACIVEIEATDALTEPQIVAKVRKHYDIVPPGSAARAGLNRGRTQ